MRIAYICADPGVPVFGRKGCSIHVQEVIGALKKQGFQVELFASSVGGEPPPGLETVPIHKLPSPKGERSLREQAAIAANRDLQAALESAGSFDLVYERYSLWSYAGMSYAKAMGVPGILEVNAPLIEEQEKYRGLVDQVSAQKVAVQVFATATVLIAVSSAIAEYLRRYPGTENHIHVIPNAVNIERFPANLKPSYNVPGTFTVGFVGSLKPWHGLSVLVEAFALLHQQAPDTRLLIVGDGIERPNLETDLLERGLLKAVHFTGAVAPNEVPGILASMNAAVAPYPQQLHFYFSPLKVYEYLAAGLPVVASGIGQLTELIQDGINGLLCPPGDAIALAATLNQLRCDPALAVRLGQAGRMTVLQNYTWDGAVQRILQLASAQPMLLQHQQEVRI